MEIFRRNKPISATVTYGSGSEKHNVDPEFRRTLPHVDSEADDVIYLHPHKPYQEWINSLARPYIEEYNRRRDAAYQAAFARYQQGKRKTKPQKSSYKHKDFDYYGNPRLHYNNKTGKHEFLPSFLSLIIHLGDREDRVNGTISQEIAIAIFRELLQAFVQLFPMFELLCAVVHTGEYGDETHDKHGGWHMHIDFLPWCERDPDAEGLRISTSLESAMRKMGYEPEESIVINHHRPLLFNTLRNELFRAIERILPQYGFRLQLGVSSDKYPDQNPSENLPMADWQAHMRETADIQNIKNSWLDILMTDEVSPDAVKQALGSLAIAQDAMRVFQGADKTWDGNAYKIRETDYTRLRGAIETMIDTMAHVVSKAEQADVYAEQVEDLTQQLAAMQTANTQLEQEVARLRRYDLDRHIKVADAERRCLDMQRTIDRMISFMAGIEHGGRKLYDLYNEMFGDDRSKARE